MSSRFCFRVRKRSPPLHDSPGESDPTVRGGPGPRASARVGRVRVGAARLAGVPAICTFHGHADLPDGDPFRAARIALLKRTASRLVFVSESLRRFFIESTGIAAAATEVIPNGVRLDRFEGSPERTLRRDLGLPEGTLLFGSLGNVRGPKGYEYLLRAAALLPDTLPRWHVAIVGDTSGSVFPALDTLRRELGLEDRVSFVGFREDVPEVLASFDVFVLPSLSEGFSLATVQALAAGRPVVATRSGGPEEMIEDLTSGLLVDAGDAAALARALERLIQEPELGNALAAAGRAAVRDRFSMESMIGAYTELYGRTLRGPRHSAQGTAKNQTASPRIGEGLRSF